MPVPSLVDRLHVVTFEHSRACDYSTCIFRFTGIAYFYNTFMVLGLQLRYQFESFLVFPVTSWA